jgi:hypothetical protein
MPRVLVATCVAAIPCAIQTQNDPALAPRTASVMNRPEFRHALWGIEIFDAAGIRGIQGCGVSPRNRQHAVLNPAALAGDAGSSAM